MAAQSRTTALTLYDNETFTLEQAAGYIGVSTGRMASTLGSWGIALREEDQRLLSNQPTK